METIGEYEYDTKNIIGHGAFAVVFKGRHKKNPDLTVAVKCITKKNIAKTQSLLGKEIKILQELTELHHENVVALFDCKENLTTVFLVMEFCIGGDLADYLGNKGTLSEDTIRLFLIQLAGAMKALYAKGIVHRDLKPQNILLSHTVPNPQPADIKLKIADFGFARFLQDGVMAATLCGSPMYMAPEVIMSLQYDAKADLWSLGTIVFQCLTGKAPFQASSPQALKQYYDKNANLSPLIPKGTSDELAELLTGLLKRNAKDRMNFETFFNHKFLKRPEPTPLLQVDLPLPIYGSPPNLAKISIKSSNNNISSNNNNKVAATTSNPESPRSTRITLSSSPEDDYVIVPKNPQLDQSSSESVEIERHFKMPIRSSPIPCCAPIASPLRPSFLPITEPIPVPTQREAYMRMTRMAGESGKSGTGTVKVDTVTPAVSSSVPRSQPINMKRSESRSIQNDISISSLSPPSVQFVIGTPPGGGAVSVGNRRRSTSGGSLSETPPPSNFWTISPVAVAKNHHHHQHSPLRRSSGTSPTTTISGLLAKVPIMSSPNLTGDNNNLGRRSPITQFCTRAITLPEISEMGNFLQLSKDTSTTFDHPITFLAPELSEETLLEKEHNDTLAKINFVLALSNSIIELASHRSGPLAALVDPSTQYQPQTMTRRRAEQFVLLVRALQLLGSGLALATRQLKSGQLRPSSTVKKVVSTLNTKFRTILSDCKRLSTSEIVTKSADVSADKLLFNHAIQMCQSAAVDELFNNTSNDCFQKYQTAQILLHSLSQVQQLDSALLTKYKEAVEKRLYILQQQGYVYSTDAFL